MSTSADTFVEIRDVVVPSGLTVLPIARDLPIVVPSRWVGEARMHAMQVRHRTARAVADVISEAGFAPLLRMLRHAPLLGWALSLQFVVAVFFAATMFGVELLVISLLGFAFSLLLANTAAARLEMRAKEFEGG